METLKLIDDIIAPYVVKTRADLKLAEDQKVLLIWDVFRGQMTNAVKQKLCSLNRGAFKGGHLCPPRKAPAPLGSKFHIFFTILL